MALGNDAKAQRQQDLLRIDEILARVKKMRGNLDCPSDYLPSELAALDEIRVRTGLHLQGMGRGMAGLLKRSLSSGQPGFASWHSELSWLVERAMENGQASGLAKAPDGGVLWVGVVTESSGEYKIWARDAEEPSQSPWEIEQGHASQGIELRGLMLEALEGPRSFTFGEKLHTMEFDRDKGRFEATCDESGKRVFSVRAGEVGQVTEDSADPDCEERTVVFRAPLSSDCEATLLQKAFVLAAFEGYAQSNNLLVVAGENEYILFPLDWYLGQTTLFKRGFLRVPAGRPWVREEAWIDVPPSDAPSAMSMHLLVWLNRRNEVLRHGQPTCPSIAAELGFPPETASEHLLSYLSDRLADVARQAKCSPAPVPSRSYVSASEAEAVARTIEHALAEPDQVGPRFVAGEKLLVKEATSEGVVVQIGDRDHVLGWGDTLKVGRFEYALPRRSELSDKIEAAIREGIEQLNDQAEADAPQFVLVGIGDWTVEVGSSSTFEGLELQVRLWRGGEILPWSRIRPLYDPCPSIYEILSPQKYLVDVSHEGRSKHQRRDAGPKNAVLIEVPNVSMKWEVPLSKSV